MNCEKHSYDICIAKCPSTSYSSWFHYRKAGPNIGLVYKSESTGLNKVRIPNSAKNQQFLNKSIAQTPRLNKD